MDKEIQVVGEVASGEEALIQAEHLSLDIVLLDILMPGMGGIETIRRLKGKWPVLDIIALTAYGDSYLDQAIEAGAVGYLLKDISPKELTQAVRATYRGQSPLSPSLSRPFFKEFAYLVRDKLPPKFDLSERQLKILQLIATGATNKEIGAQLFLSDATIKRETNSIFAKLNVRDRTEAVSEAYKRKLV
jgi:DNA-binding NarL/FixJ family response regulator